VYRLSPRTRHIANGQHAHRMNGTPVSKRSPMRPVQDAAAPMRASHRP
jgi:hypothetical protein